MKIKSERNVVLGYLLDMSDKSGYVLNPIALAHFAMAELEKRNPNVANAPETARNIAYLYACLCNEYTLAKNSKLCKETGEFYVTEWKWGKYKIGRKLKEKVSLLADFGWIECRYGYYHTMRNLYKINMDKLRRMSENAKGFRSEKQLDTWAENIIRDKKKAKITCKFVDRQMSEFLKENKEAENVNTATD